MRQQNGECRKAPTASPAVGATEPVASNCNGIGIITVAAQTCATHEASPFCSLELKMMNLCLRLVGVWVTTRRLTFRETLARHFGLTWLVLSLLTIVCLVLRMGTECRQRQMYSIAQVTRIALTVLDSVAHIYCYYLLRRYEANLVEFVTGSGKKCKYVRLLRFLAVVSPFNRVILHALNEWYNPHRTSIQEVFLQVVFSPLKVAYDLSMVIYMMATVSLCDQVDCFKELLTSKIKECGIVDLRWICREAVTFKYSLRAKVRRINCVFSVPILVLYFKLFTYYLIFIYVAVINRSAHQRHLEAALYVGCSLHSTIEIVIMSQTTMYFIRRLREATDCVTDLALTYDIHDMTLLSEVQRILDFDSARDAVTVWDSFVLCRATTVKFFVGMISCVSIILQFDVNFTDALDKMDVH